MSARKEQSRRFENVDIHGLLISVGLPGYSVVKVGEVVIEKSGDTRNELVLD